MKTACIYQVGYYQPLHYYSRIVNSDVFVFLDDVQINRKAGQNKAKIKVGEKAHDLIVPLIGGHRKMLNECMPDYAEFVHAHLKTIDHAYRKALNHDKVLDAVDTRLSLGRTAGMNFADLCFVEVLDVLSFLGYEGKIIRSSSLEDVPRDIPPSKLMAEYTQAVGCKRYLCGRPAYENYLNLSDFSEAGIIVDVQDWTCKKYLQHGKDFIPNLSILDALMHCSRDELQVILKEDEGCTVK